MRTEREREACTRRHAHAHTHTYKYLARPLGRGGLCGSHLAMLSIRNGMGCGLCTVLCSVSGGKTQQHNMAHARRGGVLRPDPPGTGALPLLSPSHTHTHVHTRSLTSCTYACMCVCVGGGGPAASLRPRLPRFKARRATPATQAAWSSQTDAAEDAGETATATMTAHPALSDHMQVALQAVRLRRPTEPPAAAVTPAHVPRPARAAVPLTALRRTLFRVRAHAPTS
jgi:hypothetical protein